MILSSSNYGNKIIMCLILFRKKYSHFFLSYKHGGPFPLYWCAITPLKLALKLYVSLLRSNKPSCVKTWSNQLPLGLKCTLLCHQCLGRPKRLRESYFRNPFSHFMYWIKTTFRYTSYVKYVIFIILLLVLLSSECFCSQWNYIWSSRITTVKWTSINARCFQNSQTKMFK